MSFATLEFYGVNAFKFTNAKGISHYARYQIEPVAGEQALPEDQVKQAAPNYLMDELPQRIARGPVKFRLLAQVAEEGDSINDGTAVWPDTRKRILLGTISLTSTVKDQAAAQKIHHVQPLESAGGHRALGRPGVCWRVPRRTV